MAGTHFKGPIYSNGLVVPTLSTDGTSLVSGNGTDYPLFDKWRRAQAGFPLIAPPVSGLTTNAAANLTINSSAAAAVNGETVWTVNATATNTTNNYFEIHVPLQTQAFAASDMTAEFAVDSFAKVDAAGGGIVYYMGTASYSLFSSYSIQGQLTASTTSPLAINGMTAYQVRENLWSKSGFSDAVGNQAWVNSKIRVYVTNGQTITFSLRSIVYGASRAKGRLAIVSDDGYASWIKLGVPVLREFGLLSSCAIIYDSVGTSDKATLSQLQQYVAEGNECIAHGPNDGTGGTGNLYTTWTTDAQRIADINACRDYLIANRLCSSWGAKSYVWPQGRFTTDTTAYPLLALMQSNGYTVARSAQEPTTHYAHKLNAISTTSLMPFATQIVGHTWVSGAGEVTNIPAIAAKIAVLAQTRTDSTLMLHRVVGVDSAAASTEISINRLRELCTAIRAEVDAGNVEVVLYSEFAK